MWSRWALSILAASSLWSCASHHSQGSVTGRIIRVEGKNAIGHASDAMILVAEGPHGERGTQLVSTGTVGERCRVGDIVNAHVYGGILLIDARTCRNSPAKPSG